jgi:hypothetical protein
MFVAFPLEMKSPEAGGCNTALGASDADSYDSRGKSL